MHDSPGPHKRFVIRHTTIFGSNNEMSLRYLLPLVLVAVLVGGAGCSGITPATETPQTPVVTSERSPTPSSSPSPTPTQTMSEFTIGTPTPTTVSPDPDGDGLSSYQERTVLPNASPERMDVYVEIDYVNGTTPPENLDQLVETYANAPVENPNGRDGIRLHLVVDDRIPATVKDTYMENSWDGVLRDEGFQSEYFDNARRGYHYALLVPDLYGNVRGNADPGLLVAKASYPNRTDRLALQIFAHELGHSLGLTHDVFEGIAGHDRSYREYPSVMSYAGIYNSSTTDFSNGTNSPRDHDDWGYLDENLFTPSTENLPTADSTRTPTPAATPSQPPPSSDVKTVSVPSGGRSTLVERAFFPLRR